MDEFNRTAIEDWLKHVAVDMKPISIDDESDILWGHIFRLPSANNVFTSPLLMISYSNTDQLSCGFVVQIGGDLYSSIESLSQPERRTLWLDIIDLISTHDVDFRLESDGEEEPITLGDNIQCPEYIMTRKTFYEMPTLTTLGDWLQQLQSLYYRLRVRLYRTSGQSKS